jgi:hypothetical protein
LLLPLEMQNKMKEVAPQTIKTWLSDSNPIGLTAQKFQKASLIPKPIKSNKRLTTGYNIYLCSRFYVKEIDRFYSTFDECRDYSDTQNNTGFNYNETLGICEMSYSSALVSNNFDNLAAYQKRFDNISQIYEKSCTPRIQNNIFYTTMNMTILLVILIILLFLLASLSYIINKIKL